MPYHSHIHLLGHAVAPAEGKALEGGFMANFRVAVNTRAKVNGEWCDRTTFYRCTIFGKQAEWLARDMQKGSLVLVSGEHSAEEWEKDGVKRITQNVKCSEATVIKPKGEQREEAPAAAPAPAPSRPVASAAYNDEPPF